MFTTFPPRPSVDGFDYSRGQRWTKHSRKSEDSEVFTSRDVIDRDHSQFSSRPVKAVTYWKTLDKVRFKTLPIQFLSKPCDWFLWPDVSATFLLLFSCNLFRSSGFNLWSSQSSVRFSQFFFDVCTLLDSLITFFGTEIWVVWMEKQKQGSRKYVKEGVLCNSCIHKLTVALTTKFHFIYQ